MNRRGFLGSAMAIGVSGALSTRSAIGAAAGSGIVSSAVVLTDITAETDIALLEPVIARLLDKGIWITCAIRLPDAKNTDTAESERRLAGTLGMLVQSGSGIDFALDLPGLSTLSPYFQARAIHEARTRLRRIAGNAGPRIEVPSVLCQETPSPQPPTGVRASGVRSVLVLPDTNRKVESESWDNGVVRFFGGWILSPGEGLHWLTDDKVEGSNLILYLSAGAMAKLPADALSAWVEGFADALLEQELAGRLALMTVPDLQLRDDYDHRRLVSVVLDLPENAGSAARETAAAFRAELADIGISAMEKGTGAQFWVETAGDTADLVALETACDAPGPLHIRAARPVGPGYAVRFVAQGAGGAGLDGCASLALPLARPSQDQSIRSTIETLAGAGDFVISISADQIHSPEARLRVLSVLKALRGDAVTRFVPLRQLAGTLLTDEPVVLRHRLTRAAMASRRQAAPARIDNAERDRLLDDARHAWGYLAKYTDPRTGLCPATVDSRPGGEIHQTVTMWDVGSNINAIVAASEIGLIDKARAADTLKRILPNIAGRRTDARLLPQGWIRTDRHRWGIRDFDGCDGGRLLSSLDNMRRRFGMVAELEKLVGSWDLDKVVVNREIHSVINRELVSTFGSHCAHYSALAFRRWGFDVASPYETFTDGAPGDGEVAMLQAVAGIGPLGSEPLLLEAMELGMSAESGYLAEVLFSAMQEEHAQSGRLLCVSETPIDQSPWFIYQGLELGSGPRSWRLDTVGHQPEFLTAAAAEQYLTFSTKAAFLWAAYKPGSFSRELLAYARARARNKVGFASGINLKTQKVTAGYSDLNSNAIILQSVAHMLRNTG